jgi:hypothetical protein
MNEEFLEKIIILLIDGLFLGVITFWLRKRITVSIENKFGIVQKEREVFSRLLDLHSELLVDESFDPWLKRFYPTIKEALLWCPDNVVREYTLYARELLGGRFNNGKEVSTHHLHFAKAILAFRKRLGYKNWFHRIKAEDIAITFSFGKEQP